MPNITYSLAAVILVSALSLTGIFALNVKEKLFDDFLYLFVSFAAGGILGAAYLDLMPEALHLAPTREVIALHVVGFMAFFLLERLVYWFHGHGHADLGGVRLSSEDRRAGVKRYVYLNLLGDGIHNAMDGIVIASSFLAGTAAGLATTVAVILHEVPQEIGDFAVLVHGGITKLKALGLNFLTALTAVFGVFLAGFFLGPAEAQLGLALSFMAGGFVYLSASELIPEIRREGDLAKSLIQFGLFSAGVALIWFVITVLPE